MEKLLLDCDLSLLDGVVEGTPSQEVLAPLGLTGEYEVRGLYELRDIGNELRAVKAPFKMRLDPSTSVLAVLCEAAKVHDATFGCGDHHFVESVSIEDKVIELGMGS